MTSHVSHPHIIHYLTCITISYNVTCNNASCYRFKAVFTSTVSQRNHFIMYNNEVKPAVIGRIMEAAYDEKGHAGRYCWSIFTIHPNIIMTQYMSSVVFLKIGMWPRKQFLNLKKASCNMCWWWINIIFYLCKKTEFGCLRADLRRLACTACSKVKSDNFARIWQWKLVLNRYYHYPLRILTYNERFICFLKFCT